MKVGVAPSGNGLIAAALLTALAASGMEVAPMPSPAENLRHAGEPRRRRYTPIRNTPEIVAWNEAVEKRKAQKRAVRRASVIGEEGSDEQKSAFVAPPQEGDTP